MNLGARSQASLVATVLALIIVSNRAVWQSRGITLGEHSGLRLAFGTMISGPAMSRLPAPGPSAIQKRSRTSRP